MIILLLLILGFKPLVTTANPLVWRCDSEFGIEASTYQANIELLSAALSMSASSTQTIFAKGFAGTKKDCIYGTAQCRGDAIASACPSCITTAFHYVWQLCQLQTATLVLYENCIVHISQEDLIYDSSDMLKRLLVFTNTTERTVGPRIPFEVSLMYTSPRIDGNIKVLLQETAKQAAYNSTMMYATGRLDVFRVIPLLYSLVQCNLDLPPNDCWDCLKNISSAAKSFFKEQHGEWIAGPWCNFRYSTYQFYEGQPMHQTAWSDDVDPTINMPAPKPAPGPVGVPRQKDEDKPVVVVPRQKHKSKQDNMLFLSPKLGGLTFLLF